MLKHGRVTKVKMLFLVLVFVFNFDLFKISAAILEKGLFNRQTRFEGEIPFLVLNKYTKMSKRRTTRSLNRHKKATVS